MIRDSDEWFTEDRARSSLNRAIEIDTVAPPTSREELPGISISVPTTADELDHVRELMQAFVGWHRERHRSDLALIDAYFDEGAFAHELTTLPGKYQPPDGQLLLATVDGRAAGCVALRRIDAAACEMKRMFVHPHLHGRGVGRALAEAVIKEARGLGYATMLLDTSIRQTEARALYARLGFGIVEPYYELPDPLRDWLVFMRLTL